jgi:hypothetical protein
VIDVIGVCLCVLPHITEGYPIDISIPQGGANPSQREVILRRM